MFSKTYEPLCERLDLLSCHDAGWHVSVDSRLVVTIRHYRIFLRIASASRLRRTAGALAELITAIVRVLVEFFPAASAHRAMLHGALVDVAAQETGNRVVERGALHDLGAAGFSDTLAQLAGRRCALG